MRINPSRARTVALSMALTVAAGLLLAAPAAAQIVVMLEVAADDTPVRLEPSDRSPVVETMARGAVLKQASAQKFRTSWIYVQFASSRSGRTLAGYVLDSAVRKLNGTLKALDLTPRDKEVADPGELDLSVERLPRITWGVSRGTVLRAEGRPLSREFSGNQELLHYHRSLLGRKCLLCYVMDEQKLVSLRVHLLERYADKDLHVADYRKIKEFLHARVGEPRYDNVVWNDPGCAACPVRLGEAVVSGCLCMSSEWVFQGTGVRLSLTGGNGGILFAAELNAVKAADQASF